MRGRRLIPVRPCALGSLRSWPMKQYLFSDPPTAELDVRRLSLRPPFYLPDDGMEQVAVWVAVTTSHRSHPSQKGPAATYVISASYGRA